MIGAIMSGTAKGGLMGAFSAAAFFDVGRWAGISNATRVGLHAMTGGIVEHAQGGTFGHGFISAGLSKLAMPAINTKSMYADAALVALTGGTISRLTGGKFANGAMTAAMQFAFNQLSQRAAFHARTVTVAEGFDLTDEDTANIAGINQALSDAGLAIYASGDAEAISLYRNAELVYDPIALAEMDARDGGSDPSEARAGQGRITFGRGGGNAWTAMFSGANDGSRTYANATFHLMTGRSMRSWLVLHEFGHLHSNYSYVANDPIMTENRANAFARKMTPYLQKVVSPHVVYDKGANFHRFEPAINFYH